MRHLIAAGLCLVLPPAADLAPPGTKLVVNTVIVEWPDSLDGHTFVAHPSRAPGGMHRIVRGEPLPPVSEPFVPRIHSVPRDVTVFPETREGWEATGWPAAELPMRLRRVVSALSPVSRIRTTVRVASVGPVALELVVVSQQELDEHGNEVSGSAWILQPAVALVGLVLLLWVFRARRRASTA